MTKSLIRKVTRRRVAVAAATIAAVGAFAVPGVAWAQNGVPSGPPTAVGEPAAVVAPAAASAEITPGVVAPGCSAPAKPLSDEEIQKLIADGVIAKDTVSAADENGAVRGAVVTVSGDTILGDGVSPDTTVEPVVISVPAGEAAPGGAVASTDAGPIAVTDADAAATITVQVC